MKITFMGGSSTVMCRYLYLGGLVCVTPALCEARLPLYDI